MALACLILAACGSATPTPSPEPIAAAEASGLIVAMGDSLTEGFGVDPEDAYPDQLERRLREEGYDFTVVNAGISGETSSGARSRIDWVLTLEPEIVILATGGNDGLRGIDPQVTGENVDALVQALKARGVVVVLAGMEIVENMGREYSDTFRAIYSRVAEEREAILIPFFLAGVAEDRELRQPDFIHPTAEGYTVVVETIYPFVVEAIEELRGR